jgi:hypothetical protein
VGELNEAAERLGYTRGFTIQLILLPLGPAAGRAGAGLDAARLTADAAGAPRPTATGGPP